ncbi:MED14-domain-containing protein [Auriscalpium vulgare]|uniref:MED14-domain-containing protein n=1 Tax=Auriscalpium vulgare TaxID=40419 RepID=A0ACB8RMG8_9AGAM|nr:MED14-domain-containing protein [Auriscalpium vulgare]
MALNGTNLAASTSYQQPSTPDTFEGDILDANGLSDADADLVTLQSELPFVDDGQVHFGDVVSRVVQACYAEVTELAETLPGMSDSGRKRKLADFVVAWKKQVVKLYAVAKWSRDADIVQKCMNITAFLMSQSRQFEDVIHGLTYAKESLDPARLRNHDLLTSLDVLTTGSYRRLPTDIKKYIVPPPPLTDEEIAQTLTDVESLIRHRLRIVDIVPIEMSKYRIADGRVFFTVPQLFEVSVSLLGGAKHDAWFFVNVEFLFHVGGDHTGMQEFPRKPVGILKHHFAQEADRLLAYYTPTRPEELQQLPSGLEVPLKKQLPAGMINAPLIRLYNFLQMMSLTYQLEILWFQAERLRSLGWADFLKVEMSADRKTLKVSYWIRQPPINPPAASRFRLPLAGGTLSIALLTSTQPQRSPKSRVLAELQERSKIASADQKPSDTVEGAQWKVQWEPVSGALGVKIRPDDAVLHNHELTIDAGDLDLEHLLRKVIEKHIAGIFNVFLLQLQHGSAFSLPNAVAVVREDGAIALRAHLCADELVIVTIDPRTGRLSLRDTGDLGAAGRGPRFLAITEKLNENPGMLLDALVRLRMNTIIELAEQKANYLGLQTYRNRNFSRDEFAKLGPHARSLLYIQLSPFPNHYLMLVVTDQDFRYALISVDVVTGSVYQSLTMEDIGWLEVERICGHGKEDITEAHLGKRKRDADVVIGPGETSRFRLETHVLRELYAYCCARVAHTKVENQLKARSIPYKHVHPSFFMGSATVPTTLGQVHSTLSHTIPALCVQSKDILAGSPAFEAAMPNIRVIPLSWWSTSASPFAGEHPPQVITLVKLKYVQQPIGRRANAGTSIIRPSKRIVYDANEAIVCFLADQVEGCVDEFLEEWASVSKIVVIAREVARMSKEKQWQDIRLLSFDLQTVEFAYASDYTVAITCKDQLSTGGSYNLRFSRAILSPQPEESADNSQRPHNPHMDAEHFLHSLLSRGKLSQALPAFVSVLRSTVPILEVLEEIKAGTGRRAAVDGDALSKLQEVDIFPKAAGWWRILFGVESDHGLDFRLLAGGRVAILDACYPMFGRAAQPRSIPGVLDPLGLRPIPGMRGALSEAIKASRGRKRRVADIDIGAVCGVDDVRAVGRKVWEGIMQAAPHEEGIIIKDAPS